jgi:hypothetical protein
MTSFIVCIVVGTPAAAGWSGKAAAVKGDGYARAATTSKRELACA